MSFRVFGGHLALTVNTDAPLVFANTLNGEYVALAAEAGFTQWELAQLARNGWDVADVPAATRAAMLAEVERVVRLLSVLT